MCTEPWTCAGHCAGYWRQWCIRLRWFVSSKNSCASGMVRIRQHWEQGLYVNRREGRWYNRKNRIDSEESLKIQTSKHIFCSGFLITETRRLLSSVAQRPLEIHDRASQPSESPPPN